MRIDLERELRDLAEQRRQRIALRRALWAEHQRRRQAGLRQRHRTKLNRRATP